MTARWYEVLVLELLPNAVVLDVGIGTGSALCANKTTVLQKNISFLGIDYNGTYVTSAKSNLVKAGLDKTCAVMQGSVYEIGENPALPKGYKCDAVYFSGSFSLMPDPSKALKVCAKYLKKGGKIYITQTFQRRTLPGMALIKPLVKYITTIDFGALVMEHEVHSMVKGAGMRIERNEVIKGSVDNIWQAAYLVVIDPWSTHSPPPSHFSSTISCVSNICSNPTIVRLHTITTPIHTL
jgi:ubiquinone/menaquinone biosynthesis C-methylase UbiE